MKLHKDRAVTGFNIDEQQAITVPSGWGWNDKAGSRWRAADFDAPPPKSKLLAAEPNYMELTPWLSENEADATDVDKSNPTTSVTRWIESLNLPSSSPFWGWMDGVPCRDSDWGRTKAGAT